MKPSFRTGPLQNSKSSSQILRDLRMSSRGVRVLRRMTHGIYRCGTECWRSNRRFGRKFNYFATKGSDVGSTDGSIFCQLLHQAALWVLLSVGCQHFLSHSEV